MERFLERSTHLALRVSAGERVDFVRFFMKVIEMAIIEQPARIGGRNAGYTQYHRGGPKSVARLRNLQFDPIGELVAKYRKLESEIEYQEKIKTGEIQVFQGLMEWDVNLAVQ